MTIGVVPSPNPSPPQVLRQRLPKGWQDIKTAPRDGRVILSYWDYFPVFIAWSEGSRPRELPRLWPWSKIRVEPGEPAGFRVLVWSPRFNHWGFNGNCAPFWPKYWHPIPERFWPARRESAPPESTPGGGST